MVYGRSVSQQLTTFSVNLMHGFPSGNIISEETYFLRPNPYTTITSPGNSRNPLTVGAYNQLSGSILISSSRGYTPSNLVKPDIVARDMHYPAQSETRLLAWPLVQEQLLHIQQVLLPLLMEWAVEKRETI